MRATFAVFGVRGFIIAFLSVLALRFGTTVTVPKMLMT